MPWLRATQSQPLAIHLANLAFPSRNSARAVVFAQLANMVWFLMLHCNMRRSYRLTHGSHYLHGTLPSFRRTKMRQRSETAYQ